MKKILLIHPEGNINNNPNLTGIVEILCENGYTVEIVSQRRQDIPQKPPCDGSLLRLIDVPNFAQAYYFPFAIPRELFQRPENLRSYLKESYGGTDLVIGVDRGIIESSLIARTLGISFGLISYEIYFEEETGREFKEPEIVACKGISFAVCQGKVRSAHLARENRIPPERIFDIPVAGRSVGRGEHTYALHDMLKIDRKKKIALYIGEVTSQWAAVDEIVESAARWEDWALVLHHRYGNLHPDVLARMGAKGAGHVYVSPFPSLPFEQMHMLLHSADMGIAFYVSHRAASGINERNNLRYLGTASGKICTYLQYGLPVLINEIGEMSEHVRQNNLGVVVSDFKDIPSLLKTITRERLSELRNNCLRFFESKLDLDITVSPLLDKIKLLRRSSALIDIQISAGFSKDETTKSSSGSGNISESVSEES